MPPIFEKKLSAFAVRKEIIADKEEKLAIKKAKLAAKKVKLAVKKANLAESKRAVFEVNIKSPISSNTIDKVSSRKKRNRNKKVNKSSNDNLSSTNNSIIISDDDDNDDGDDDDVVINTDEDDETAINDYEVKDNDVKIIDFSNVNANLSSKITKDSKSVSNQSNESTSQVQPISNNDISNKGQLVGNKRKQSQSSKEKTLAKKSKPDKNVENQVTSEDEVVDMMENESRQKLDIIAIPVSDSDVIVVVKHPVEFALKGYGRVQMLGGQVKIMEYELSPNRKTYDLFSLTNSSLIKVKTIKTIGKEKKWLKRMQLNKQIVAEIERYMTLYEECVVIRFTKLKSNVCSYIKTLSTYTKMFHMESDRTVLNDTLLPLNVAVVDDSNSEHKITVCDELQQLLDGWELTLSQINDVAPVMLICGGKDSGKSTTMRMMINTALNKLDRIYYLECDVGQTEFTPPGVISLIEVTTPLLGSPFTHQQTPVCCYHFGGVSAIDNPDEYIHCINLCIQQYNKLDTTIPLVINCMGWMKGLGWQLLLDVIKMTSPTHIVQLKAMIPSQNIDPITIDHLQDTSYTDLSQMYNGPPVPSKLMREPTITTMKETFAVSHSFKKNAVDLRNLSILSHLSCNLEPGLSLSSVTPYTVSWKDVAIRISHINLPKKQVMYALNASMVALCEADITQAELLSKDGPLFLDQNEDVPYKWIGYGIVRGIDMVHKKYYVVTSLNEKDLSRVNLLEKSGIAVPENFLTAQKCEKILYVDEVIESIGLAAIRPRKHLPRKKLGD